MVKEAKIPLENLVLVTLTRRIVSGKPLSVLLSETREAFSKLIRRSEWLSTVRGGLYSIEAVPAGRAWNLHMHLLVEAFGVETYWTSKKDLSGVRRPILRANLLGPSCKLRGDQLGRLWHGITGDSVITDISPVRSDLGGLHGAVSYIVKYMAKGYALGEDARAEYNLAFRGRRLISAFGAWYAMKPRRYACPDCGSVNFISSYDLVRLTMLSHEESKSFQPRSPSRCPISTRHCEQLAFGEFTSGGDAANN